MRLNSLSILNYKNIGEAQMNFAPGVNCLIGNNAMGKTNILLISLKKIGPFAGIAGVIIAVAFFFITKSRYKNMGKSGTYDLASNSKVDLDEVEDTFVTQHTTVRTIKSDNDSGSGSSNHSDGSGSRAF